MNLRTRVERLEAERGHGGIIFFETIYESRCGMSECGTHNIFAVGNGALFTQETGEPEGSFRDRVGEKLAVSA